MFAKKSVFFSRKLDFFIIGIGKMKIFEKKNKN